MEKTYEVRLKTQPDVVITTYTSATPVEWAAYPFTLYAHDEKIEPPVAPIPLARKYLGRRELTHEEFRELFAAEEQWDIDAFEAGFEQMALDPETKNRIRSGLKSYYAATFVELDNPKVALVLGVFAGLQLIAVYRIEEILYG
jgi:hypothetical protein